MTEICWLRMAQFASQLRGWHLQNRMKKVLVLVVLCVVGGVVGLEFVGRLLVCGCSFFFFSSRRRHTRFDCDWSSDVCSSDLTGAEKTIWGNASAAGQVGCPSGQREQTVNLPASAYEGSNPSPTTRRAGVAQLVERQPSKLRVAGSSPVARSRSRSSVGRARPW